MVSKKGTFEIHFNFQLCKELLLLHSRLIFLHYNFLVLENQK